MGLFNTDTDKAEQEEYRGVADHRLPFLSDTKLIMLALAELLDVSVEDEQLVKELYKRGESRNGT